MNVRNTIVVFFLFSVFVCLQRCGPKKSAIEKFMELYGEKTGILNMCCFFLCAIVPLPCLDLSARI